MTCVGKNVRSTPTSGSRWCLPYTLIRSTNLSGAWVSLYRCFPTSRPHAPVAVPTQVLDGRVWSVRLGEPVRCLGEPFGAWGSRSVLGGAKKFQCLGETFGAWGSRSVQKKLVEPFDAIGEPFGVWGSAFEILGANL